MSTRPKQPVLWRADVARIWTEERDRAFEDARLAAPDTPISVRTVSSYLQKSKPADPATGRAAGDYADDPVPAPRYHGRVPYWAPTDELPTLEAVERELRAWWNRRRGRIGDPRDAGNRGARGKRL